MSSPLPSSPPAPEPPARGGRRLRRYLALDLTARLASLLAGSSVHALTGRLEPTVVAAVLGELLGFYGAAWLWARAEGGASCGPREVVRGLLREFLGAELLDAFLVRPLALTLWVRAGAAPGIAIVLGGICADAVFYVVAALSRARRARGPDPCGTEPAGAVGREAA